MLPVAWWLEGARPSIPWRLYLLSSFSISLYLQYLRPDILVFAGLSGFVFGLWAHALCMLLDDPRSRRLALGLLLCMLGKLLWDAWNPDGLWHHEFRTLWEAHAIGMLWGVLLHIRYANPGSESIFHARLRASDGDD